MRVQLEAVKVVQEDVPHTGEIPVTLLWKGYLGGYGDVSLPASLSVAKLEVMLVMLSMTKHFQK